MTKSIKRIGGIVCAVAILGIAACVQQVGQTGSSAPSKTVAPAPGTDASTLLNAHNTYRAKHGAKALGWSPSLAGDALAHAKKCNFAHSKRTRTGENLARWSGGLSAAQMVDNWYAENVGYDYAKGTAKTPGAVTGHFTQVVWKDTSEVGCGVSQCPSIGNFMVCQYRGPGNVRGQYTSNVAAPS